MMAIQDMPQRNYVFAQPSWLCSLQLENEEFITNLATRQQPGEKISQKNKEIRPARLRR